ncbi:MAG: aminotransferase DegT, partial [Steroidobacteraceae bacterium]|nr:aminotransferase DegT [Steroidobacteraceae bacterium]
IDEATIQAVATVLRSGWLASGPKVQEFEAALSAYLGSRPVRVMTSATAALEIALTICNIGQGDEVITTPMSWCSTSNVILRLGARPVFVDIDLDSRNLMLEQVEGKIGPRTRAILPVHFSGLPVDMDRLYAIATRHGLRVIEDAAHAIGSAWRGRRIGSFGDLVCFSFHPNKNMTTGEGGAIVADSPAEIRRIESHRFHGVVKRAPDQFDVLDPGIKANLSDIAACIGLGQLARLEEFNARRRELVAHYFARWGASCPLRLPAPGDTGHCWHMFAPLLPVDRIGMTRAQFIGKMDERGIGVGIHYPAIHLLSAYRKLGWREGQFPNAERVGRETITLPLFPAMRIADVDRVVDAVNDILKAAST